MGKSLPLHKASTTDLEPALRLLVEHGANLHYQDREGTTALHLAAMSGHNACVEFIVEREPSTLTMADK